MSTSPPLVLIVLWLAWLTQTILSAMQVRKFARRFDRQAREPFQDYRPPAAVIVPFKGIDRDLANGVAALCQQQYPKYELLAVVDSADDPAYPVLAEQLAKYPQQRSRVLIAGPAGPHEGQKIRNQICAIDHLLARDASDPDQPQVWVFADSDAVPGPDWLGDLVGPLIQEDRTGVTTGYRWLVPAPDSRGKTSVWSHLASIMNSSVACLSGRDSFNHAWGGSMALTAATAKRGDLRGRLVGALCDDYQFSRLSRDLGLRVYFVSRCLVATPVHFDLAGLVNFAHRQYLLTRVYAPRLFVTAFLITTLYVAGVFSATGWLLMGLWLEPRGQMWWWPAGVIGCAFVANQARASYRRRVIRQAFGDSMLTRLRATLRLERWSVPLWMTLHWLLIVRSAFGRTMRWRGILYKLYAPQRVDRISELNTKINQPAP